MQRAHTQGARTSLRRARRIAWRALRTTAIVVVLTASAVAVAAVGSGHWQIRPVLSGSMRPTFPIGGVLITERVPTASLRVGDVAVLHPPNDPNVTYIHRIVWLQHRGNELLVRTKGDANRMEDPWTARVVGPVAYEGRYVLPYVGYAAVWVHSPAGRRDLLVLAAGAFIVCGSSAAVTARRRRRSAGDDGRELPTAAPQPS